MSSQRTGERTCFTNSPRIVVVSPALWKPRPDQFRRIEAMPYLGTGKLDLRRVKELGNELA